MAHCSIGEVGRTLTAPQEEVDGDPGQDRWPDADRAAPSPASACRARGAAAPFPRSDPSPGRLRVGAPNMDACLHSVTGHRAVSRPRLDAFAQWLTGVTPPGDTVGHHDVEAQLFIAVPAARANAMAPFISAVRQSGMGVFCRDRDEGDIDDALLRFVEQRVGERPTPGTLVIATSDQGLGRETAQRAPTRAGASSSSATASCAPGPRRRATSSSTPRTSRTSSRHRSIASGWTTSRRAGPTSRRSRPSRPPPTAVSRASCSRSSAGAPRPTTASSRSPRWGSRPGRSWWTSGPARRRGAR